MLLFNIKNWLLSEQFSQHLTFITISHNSSEHSHPSRINIFHSLSPNEEIAKHASNPLNLHLTKFSLFNKISMYAAYSLCLFCFCFCIWICFCFWKALILTHCCWLVFDTRLTNMFNVFNGLFIICLFRIKHLLLKPLKVIT